VVDFRCIREAIMQPFDYHPRTRVIFGEGAIARLGEMASDLGFRRSLLVADRGLVAAGHVGDAARSLETAGITAVTYHDFAENPDTLMIERGREFAASQDVDSIIGLGGGSSMDCAKGINFVLTNGGSMKDYWGFGKASKPMLPMIGIPTTAGTGSEAQSYALISDAETHVKMACGDPKAAFRIAILDPCLTMSQPRSVTAITGFDAIAHAVETYVTTKRNAVSDAFAREAFRLLEANYEGVLAHPYDVGGRGAMLAGAHFAGVAIENSMLGATHACANPLTARYGTTHGVAIALLLPAVVGWNSGRVSSRYQELLAITGRSAGVSESAARLAARLEELASVAGLPRRLSAAGVRREDLPLLAREAASQWTGNYNPRAFDANGALEIYQAVF
jgi:alcohol dehydrogenase